MPDDLAAFIETLGLAGEDASAERQAARLLVDAMGVAIYTTDAAGSLTYYNEAAASLWGWRPPLQEQRWCGSWRIVAPDGAEMPPDQCPMAVCLREGRAVRGAWAFAERPDGQRIPFAPFPSPLRAPDGRLVGAVNVLVDISGLKAAENRLARAEARFQTAQDIAPEGFVVLEPIRDAAGTVVDFRIDYANAAAMRLLGLRPRRGREAGGRLSLVLPMHAGGPGGVLAEFTAVLETGSVSIRERGAGDGLGARSFRSRAVRLDHGVAVSFEDITARRRVEARARFLAEHDELTGLLNASGLRRRMEPMQDRADGAAILLVTLEGHRAALGRAAAEEAVRVAATRIARRLPAGAVAARIGADDFAVLVAGCPSLAVHELSAALLRDLAVPVATPEGPVALGTRVGVAVSEGAMDPDALMRDAELALSTARQGAGDRLAIFAPAALRGAPTIRQAEADLRQALAERQIEVHYQPIIATATRRIAGFEALARWKHPSRGFVSPGEFVPLAEETGLITQLGDQVLRQACRDAAGWPDALRVTVNISPTQLREEMLPRLVADALAASGLAARRLELELSEVTFLGDERAAAHALATLRAQGVALALDDFGSGFCSLAQLRSFPVGRVKIDRNLVVGVDAQREGAAIIRAIMRLAADLGLATTAEGVNTPGEFDRLAAEGCAEAQGFLFSPAQPAAAIPSLLARFG
ncbi:EAL domain-containing protein [Falsiroseomonas ponticola]|uniref:EAL domain-containing protein n=1 Tax=Falsiroseomonas ponticola TaxID=2786951 RepID=UPI0019346CD6|nr:EAL domain-containing protein [Roseomonas ponticola]